MKSRRSRYVVTMTIEVLDCALIEGEHCPDCGDPVCALVYAYLDRNRPMAVVSATACTDQEGCGWSETAAA